MIALYIVCGLALVAAIAERDKAASLDAFWGLLAWKYFIFIAIWPAILIYALMDAALIIQSSGGLTTHCTRPQTAALDDDSPLAVGYVSDSESPGAGG